MRKSNKAGIKTTKTVVKRAAALMMAGVMCVSFAACGKSDKKKEEKLDIYNATQEMVFDEYIYDSKIINDIFYGTYEKYTKEGDRQEVGLVRYDLNTKEELSVVFNYTDLLIDYYYVDNNNNIVLKAQNYIWNDEPEDGSVEKEDVTYSYQDVELIYNEKLELVSSKEGEIINSDGEFSEGERVFITKADSQGRLISMGISGTEDTGGYFIRVCDTDGNEISNFKVDDAIESLVEMSDGTVVCSVWGEKNIEIYSIDIEGGKLGEKVAELGGNWGDGIYVGLNNSFLVSSNGYLYRYESGSDKPVKMLKFMDSDINPDNVSTIFELQDGTLGVVLSSYDDSSKTEIDFLTKQEADNTVKKEELHLGTFYMDSDLQEKIINFNKTNDKYKIVVDDYALNSAGGEDDYEEAIKRFNAAITSGNCPDLIDLSSIGGIEEYAQKGILEDLLPYMEQDSEIKEDIFVESVLNAYKINGKLYSLPSSFMVNALVGATEKLGNEKSWTMQEFLAYAESLPEGTEIMDGLTSDGLLYSMLVYNMGEYVNWSTGECNFNSDEFVKLLEFCSNYENSEKYYENYDFENEPSEITKIRNNQVAMQTLCMDSIDTYLVSKVTFGEPITVKGYPTKEGNGIVIQPSSFLLGISSKSKYKDVAWEFLRELYTKEAYNIVVVEQTYWSFSGFPVRKDMLDEMLQNSKNIEGETAPDGTEFYSVWGFEDIQLYIPIPTDEDINAIKEIINSADTLSDMNSEVFSMVTEEAEAYFKGQKTAKEVADVIQSRVSIYVKENR